MSGEGAGSAPAVGPGWERVDGGGWVRRRHRASNPVDARVARALVVARERFIAPGEAGVARVPLEPGKKVLRASRLPGARGASARGLSEADVEARAEETCAYAESSPGRAPSSTSSVGRRRSARWRRRTTPARTSPAPCASTLTLATLASASARSRTPSARATKHERRNASPRSPPPPSSPPLDAPSSCANPCRSRRGRETPSRRRQRRVHRVARACRGRRRSRRARGGGNRRARARRRWSSRFCCARRDATTTRASSSVAAGFRYRLSAPCCGAPDATATPTPGRLRRRRNAAR